MIYFLRGCVGFRGGLTMRIRSKTSRPLYALAIVFACLSPIWCSAQLSGDFRSRQNGNWNSTSSWERFNGTIWVGPAPSIPTSADGTTTIQNGHTITVTANTTNDQV